VAALVGLALAAAGLTLSHLLGVPAIDAVASIAIGLVLMVEAGLLGYECRGLIIGEAARPRVIADVRRLLARHAELEGATGLRTLQLGPESVMLVLSVRPRPTMSVREASAFNAALTAEIREAVPVVKHIVYELQSPAA